MGFTSKIFSSHYNYSNYFLSNHDVYIIDEFFKKVHPFKDIGNRQQDRGDQTEFRLQKRKKEPKCYGGYNWEAKPDQG